MKKDVSVYQTDKQEYRYDLENDYNDDDDDERPLIQVQGSKNILGRANFIPKVSILQRKILLLGMKKMETNCR